MAPNPIGRQRRPRRRPAPAAPSIPKDRLPVGTRSSQNPQTLASHIQIIPRTANADDSSHSGCNNDTPTHTNPSYLAEIDPGLDLHKRDSHQRQHSAQTTFADMARAGVGPERGHAPGEFMASQEPHPLSSYVRFKKKGRSGRTWTPIDEENSFIRTSSPADQSGEKQSQPAQKMAHDCPVAINPVDALRAHFDNVKATFGRPLSDQSWLQVNVGQRNHEIQFVILPNGDIQAHQWSANGFEWSKIGEYSYMRKKLEGTLGQEQLRGQKIGSLSPQNILQHFIAVAKQYEEVFIAKSKEPKGYESGTARPIVRPAIPLITSHPQRPPVSLDPSAPISRSFSSAGYPSQRDGLPTLSNLSIRQPAPTRPMPLTPFFSDNPFGSAKNGDSSSPANISSGDISPLTRRRDVTPESSRFPLSTRKSFRDGRLGHLRQFDDITARNTHIPESARSSFGSILPSVTAGLNDVNKQIWQEEKTRVQGLGHLHHHNLVIEGENELDSKNALSPKIIRHIPTDAILRLSFDGAEHTAALSSATRPKKTQQNPFASWNFTGHKRTGSGAVPVKDEPRSSSGRGTRSRLGTGHSSYHAVQGVPHVADPPTSSGSLEPRLILKQSEPEAGYSERQRAVLTKLSTADMTNEELMIYSRPTPQNWNGPFFIDDKEQKTEEEKLWDWWYSGSAPRTPIVIGDYFSKYFTPKPKTMPQLYAFKMSGS